MGGGFRAEAAVANYKYIDYENGKFVEKETTETVKEWNSSTTNFSPSEGWYYVKETVNANGKITLPQSGTVHLILGDGATLTAEEITLQNYTDTASLTIYVQSAGTGKFTGHAIDIGGKLTINGGTFKITNTGGGNAYIRSYTNDLTINGGTFNITNTGSGTAYMDGNEVTINGGTFNITNTGSGTAYIKGKYVMINSGNITLSASASDRYAYIQSDNQLTISGGQVTVNGKDTDNGKSGIICGASGLITLGYTSADADFIQASGYYSYSNSSYTAIAPKIADGKTFAVMTGDDFATFEKIIDSITTLKANELDGKKLVPAIAITVTLNANNGTGTMNPQIFASGIAQALTANAFTRTGYSFKEWNTKQDGSGTSYADGAQVTLTENLTLYAQWELQTYKITYELNGGTIDDSANPESYTIEDAITIKAPTKNGYTFAGWTLDGSIITEIAKGSTGDKTLTATWTPITYKITYDLDGGTASNPASYTIETKSFTLTNPTKDSYTFTGWTGTDLTVATQTVEIKKGSTGDRTYTANYSENQQEQEQEQAQEQEPQEQEQEQGHGQEQEQEQGSKEYEEQVTTTSDNLAGMGTEEKAAVKYLELTDSTGTKITDLRQIDFKDFTSLNTLNLSGLKNLEQADLSRLPANVKNVNLQKTNIKLLNLNKSKVERVNAAGCKNLTNIEAENNDSLTELDVSESSIIKINVKNCTKLKSLNCSSCDLEAGYLNLEGCSSLTSLDISKNHFGWFDYNELGSSLNSFECSSQDITGWESKTTFSFTKFFNSGDVTTAGVHIMASAYTANVAGITGYNESGDKIPSEYDSSTGIATFASAPAVIKYFYDTGFNNSSMDVTIHSSRYQEEVNYYLGDSGGCNAELSFSSLIFAVFAFMFTKRR